MAAGDSLRYLPNIQGVIVGHALIVGTFPLPEALTVAAQQETSPQPETITPVAEHGIQRGTRAYLAAYNRSQAARWWNAALRDAITSDNPYIEVLIPQEDLAIDKGSMSPRAIQASYEAELDKADLVIVVLDGIENEAWTGYECGYARAKQKYLVGVQAQSQDDDPAASRFNAMCDEIVYYDPQGDWHASLASIAQELSARVLRHDQVANG